MKIPAGGWYPLVAGAFIFTLTITWRRGHRLQNERLSDTRIPISEISASLAQKEITRPPGAAVFFAPMGGDLAPAALSHLADRIGAVPATLLVVSIDIRHQPYVPAAERIEKTVLAPGLYHLRAAYGFMQPVNMPVLLGLSKFEGLDLDESKLTYIVSRETLVAARRGRILPDWQEHVYGFLNRNALRRTDSVGIPPDKVIEIGLEIEV